MFVECSLTQSIQACPTCEEGQAGCQPQPGPWQPPNLAWEDCMCWGTGSPGSHHGSLTFSLWDFDQDIQPL